MGDDGHMWRSYLVYGDDCEVYMELFLFIYLFFYGCIFFHRR